MKDPTTSRGTVIIRAAAICCFGTLFIVTPILYGAVALAVFGIYKTPWPQILVSANAAVITGIWLFLEWRFPEWPIQTGNPKPMPIRLITAFFILGPLWMGFILTPNPSEQPGILFLTCIMVVIQQLMYYILAVSMVLDSTLRIMYKHAEKARVAVET